MEELNRELQELQGKLNAAMSNLKSENFRTSAKFFSFVSSSANRVQLIVEKMIKDNDTPDVLDIKE